jgi:hypothetical protein
MKQLKNSFKKEINFILNCFENRKRGLYLHSQSDNESDILEKWQSGRMRQS